MAKKFSDLIDVEHPIIMAPMFLVTNVDMMVAALKSGITGAIPALNFRTDDELRKAIDAIRLATDKPFGINLIVNRSNPKYKKQLATCVDKKVDFVITSLGSPQEAIEQCHKQGIKVFCDVTDLKYAKKVEELGADAVIAVNSEAGGHAGPVPADELIPMLVDNLTIPVISAGGVANHSQLQDKLNMGAIGVSVGTIFIASKESPVSDDYKQAMIQYGADDIIKTTRLSGSPLTVINTPYVREMHKKRSPWAWFQRLVKRNKWLKKYTKMLVFLRGMKKVEKAAFEPTYRTVWCAGPTIEYVDSIRPLNEIVSDLIH